MDIFRLNDSFVWRCELNQTYYADNLRFGINGVAGTTIALLSVANNALLFYAFSTSHKLRRQNYANPVLLAMFDCFVSACYLGTVSANIFAYHFGWAPLVDAWTVYVRALYTFQHICITICNFLLVVASLERFCANTPEGKQKSILVFTVKWKLAVIVLIVIAATVLKGTVYFETGIIYLPHCPPLERLVPVMNGPQSGVSISRFLIRKFATVILPFFVILYCNSKIVSQLRARRRHAKKESLKLKEGKLTSGSLRQHYNEKKGVRVATRTLLLVIGCYLISNTTSTIVNFWEFFDADTLEEHYYPYLLVQDFSAMLTIVGCFCRLPIYCLSDRRIRNAVARAVLRAVHRARPLELPAGNLEKWSLVVVSNSLRSNVTAANQLFASQEWLSGRVQRTKDELAFLLHNRRRLLVDMTIRLGSIPNERLVEESTTGECEVSEVDDSPVCTAPPTERTPCLRRVNEEEEESDDDDEGVLPKVDWTKTVADL